MFRYRFITAQRFAAQIGAGFLEVSSGRFFAYRDTQLEVEPACST
jgi:hypothetical protein